MNIYKMRKEKFVVWRAAIPVLHALDLPWRIIVRCTTIKSNKFWEAWCEGKGSSVFSRYGAAGTNGVTSERSIGWVMKKISEKLSTRKGDVYEHCGLDGEPLSFEQAKRLCFKRPSPFERERPLGGPMRDWSPHTASFSPKEEIPAPVAPPKKVTKTTSPAKKPPRKKRKKVEKLSLSEVAAQRKKFSDW